MRRSAKDIFGAVLILVWMAILGWLLLLMTSCSPRVITVPEVHEVIHHQTDSVFKVDSVFREKETTVMQLDSAAMAKYGIQLKSAERAWLVKTSELEREIERLMAMSATKDSVHDSIPVPYPVKVEPTFRERAGTAAIWLVIGGVITFVIFVLSRKK